MYYSNGRFILTSNYISKSKSDNIHSPFKNPTFPISISIVYISKFNYFRKTSYIFLKLFYMS